VVISVEAPYVGNAILLKYLTPDVACKEPEIGTADQNIPIDNNCTNYKPHFRMPRGSRDYEDDCDESDKCDAIPTASQRQRSMPALDRFNMGTSDVDEYGGEDGDDADADEVTEASPDDDGSTQHG
jgi:hypothetical protein